MWRLVHTMGKRWRTKGRGRARGMAVLTASREAGVGLQCVSEKIYRQRTAPMVSSWALTLAELKAMPMATQEVVPARGCAS